MTGSEPVALPAWRRPNGVEQAGLEPAKYPRPERGGLAAGPLLEIRDGAQCWTLTSDPWFRKPVLYTTELTVRTISNAPTGGRTRFARLKASYPNPP